MKGEEIDTLGHDACEALFRELLKFPEGGVDLLRPDLTFRSFHENTVVVRPGDTDFNLYFVLKGFGVSYRITERGDTCYLHLAPPSFVVCNLHTLHRGTPSEDFIEMKRGSLAAVIDYRVLKERAAAHPALSAWYIDLLIRALSLIYRRMEGLMSADARDRFLQLHDERPDLFTNTLKKEVAGMLGISPSTLSRLLSSKGRSRN